MKGLTMPKDDATLSAASAGSACFECGGLADVEHHVVPRSRGGTKTVRLCEDCHGKAHGRAMTTNALTRQALARKRSNGERTGQVPFGFDLASDGVTLIPNAGEQESWGVIRGLRTQGMTLREIAAELNRRGIRTKKGGPWVHSTIQRLVG
jgi:hypothetical protein